MRKSCMPTPSTSVLQLLACPLARGSRDIDDDQLWNAIGGKTRTLYGLEYEAGTAKATVYGCGTDRYLIFTIAADDTYTVHHVSIRDDLVTILEVRYFVYCVQVPEVLGQMFDR